MIFSGYGCPALDDQRGLVGSRAEPVDAFINRFMFAKIVLSHGTNEIAYLQETL